MTALGPTSPPRLSAEESQPAYAVFNDIFGNINEQLRFAEAKNGALLTVDLAVVFGISSLMGDHHADIASPVRAALIGVAAGCAIGAIVSLVSFLPELKAPKAPRKGAG